MQTWLREKATRKLTRGKKDWQRKTKEVPIADWWLQGTPVLRLIDSDKSGKRIGCANMNARILDSLGACREGGAEKVKGRAGQQTVVPDVQLGKVMLARFVDCAVRRCVLLKKVLEESPVVCGADKSGTVECRNHLTGLVRGLGVFRLK
jgi:hypothetical protein